MPLHIGASAVFGGIVAATAPGHGLLGNCWTTETREDPRHVKASDVKLEAGASTVALPAPELNGKTSTKELNGKTFEHNGQTPTAELNGNGDVNGHGDVNGIGDGDGELALADSGTAEEEEEEKKAEEKPLGRFGLPQF